VAAMRPSIGGRGVIPRSSPQRSAIVPDTAMSRSANSDL